MEPQCIKKKKQSAVAAGGREGTGRDGVGTQKA